MLKRAALYLIAVLVLVLAFCLLIYLDFVR